MFITNKAPPIVRKSCPTLTKIVLTNAPKEKHKVFFKNIDYEIFTLENKPNKQDPKYYQDFFKKP